MKKLYIILSICFLVVKTSSAQDVQFSQFYANQVFLNPAFAGGAHTHRGILHQRLQWPRLDAKYITSFASYDNFNPKYNSGYGLYVLQDYEGSNAINKTEVQLQYSYELHLSRELTFRAGFQFGYMTKSIDYEDLKFPHQFSDANGFDGSQNGYGTRDRVHMADVSSGGLFYSRNLWFGFTGNHLNKPNQTFLGGSARWPAKYSFVGGYKIPLKHPKHLAYMEDEKDISITPTLNYKLQGKADQFDLGLYGTYDQLIAGMWYRGIPFKKYSPEFRNNESIVLLVGWRYKNYTVNYSYDFTVSNLASAKTGGSHELVLTYIHHKHQKNHKPMRRIPCPTIDKKITYK